MGGRGNYTGMCRARSCFPPNNATACQADSIFLIRVQNSHATAYFPARAVTLSLSGIFTVNSNTRKELLMLNINDVKFDSHGLVPAIAVDDDSGDVLMLAYMNRQSLSITLDKKLACFWSRSRNELWLKGETSGNYLHVREILADCDRDTLLLYVKPDGPACHLGNRSCFVDDIMPREEKSHEKFTLCGLMQLIKGRKYQPLEGSYTSYLFAKGLDKILKKVGEESTEVVIAAKNDKKEAVYEISDLIYHLMVLMAEMDIDIKDIILELASRHVIDHKVKQEKMTQ